MLGVSHLSLTINSSINFLIYFSLGKRFKAASKRFILQPIPGRLTEEGPDRRTAVCESVPSWFKLELAQTKRLKLGVLGLETK